MAMMKSLAHMYAEAYCVINSLDMEDEKDWEKAMEWVESHKMTDVRKYIMENY